MSIVQLPDDPLVDQTPRRPSQQLAVGVAAEHERVELHDPVEGVGRKRARGQVTPEDQLCVARRREHGLERGQVPVDVVERSDAP